LLRAAPGHLWLDPAVTGDPGHRPARPAVAVDGKERRIIALHEDGEHTIAELAELFSMGRSTVYRAIARARSRTAEGKEAAA